MAQPGPEKTITILVDADLSLVRRKVKRALAELQEVNRELASLEHRLGTLGGKLREFGIDLEVEA